MIYYYSATGNTRFAAGYLGKRLETAVADLLDPDVKSPQALEDEPIGLMFPIYCWGIPPAVKSFFETALTSVPKNAYVWALCTCGDEAGIAMRQLDRLLEKTRGRGADALFSLIMPNTYVMMPGFDVDKPAVEQKKLEAAPGRLEEIARAIEARQSGVYDVHEGSFPALRTRLIFPLFEKWGVSPKLWKASDSCISCGKCAAICPAHNILMEDGRPRWGKHCYSCCGCFHVCPVKAVAYGSLTKDKSQYLCPLKA